MSSPRNNVFITGIGLITPLKPFKGVQEFWKALCSGEDGIKRENPPLINPGRQWLMAQIDLDEILSEEKAVIKPEEKFIFITEKAFEMAINDAHLSELSESGLVVGTILGNILCKEKRLLTSSEINIHCRNNGDSLSYITSHLAQQHNLTGPLLTVSTACASGTDAVGIAARKIESGKADVMIAGGVDVLSDFALFGFHALQALTEDKVRPFDKNRSGLALGEGAAFVVLELENHAAARGVKVYGKVKGYASRADANHLTGPHPQGRGLAKAINQALSNAHLEPQDIDYINAHGTGTLYNDLIETKAIKHVFGKKAYDIPINSTKSMLGHSFGSAGVIEVIVCLLSQQTGIIHRTINYQEKDPECDLDYVPYSSRFHHVRNALSLSAGFGGQNSAIILSMP